LDQDLTNQKKAERDFVPVTIAVLTASDSRSEATDTSGQALVERLQAAGHSLADRQVVPDCPYHLRAVVSNWILDSAVQAVITTGGTGLTGRDGTPEALRPLFDREIEGFGELFRWLSYRDIKTSTIASRCVAGVANGTLIYCLPGSTGACHTGWDEIIAPQLDYRTTPCNMVELMPRLTEK